MSREIDGEVVGCALWFLNFSTWRGVHGIYLEDLFVRPDHRGSGLGKALLIALAQECVRNNYERLEWSVLDWNTPAIDFYKSLGATPRTNGPPSASPTTALTTLGSSTPSESAPGHELRPSAGHPYRAVRPAWVGLAAMAVVALPHQQPGVWSRW